MKELDVMLERFTQAGGALDSAEQRCALEELLALPDPVLAGYLLGGNTPAEAHLARLTAAIRTYVAMQAGSGLFCEPLNGDSANPVLNFQVRSQST
jgi:succinate dehydrogenase flavin-adding protein (antitoxin of CptAB toxin-antitoxin module)